MAAAEAEAAEAVEEEERLREVLGMLISSELCGVLMPLALLASEARGAFPPSRRRPPAARVAAAFAAALRRDFAAEDLRAAGFRRAMVWCDVQ